MKNLSKRGNKLIILVISLLILSSFSITLAEQERDMPIERSMPIEEEVN